MVVAVWSVKGGVGVTSVAALLAIGQAERAEDTLLVDLDGDVPLLLGCDSSKHQPGLVDWCALAHPSADSLARIEVPARPSLTYLPRGVGDLGDLSPLAAALSESSRQVIVDCGVITEPSNPRQVMVEQASLSLLVVRECYLTLRAVQESSLTPNGVVVIKERDRRLGRLDVESAAQAPVVAELAADGVITTALDVGLIKAHLPRRLVRSLGRVLRDVA